MLGQCRLNVKFNKNTYKIIGVTISPKIIKREQNQNENIHPHIFHLLFYGSRLRFELAFGLG